MVDHRRTLGGSGRVSRVMYSNRRKLLWSMYQEHDLQLPSTFFHVQGHRRILRYTAAKNHQVNLTLQACTAATGHWLTHSSVGFCIASVVHSYANSSHFLSAVDNKCINPLELFREQ